VAEFYEADGRLATEHALLDDNGDSLGTPADFFRGDGVFVQPKWDAAWTIVRFSYAYAGGMVLRYVVRMARRRQDDRRR
jgi:hypothetical protein